MEYLNEDKETLTPVIFFAGEDQGFQVEVALQYNDGFSDNILSCQEKATQQALKSDRGSAHLSIVDESFTKVYGTFSLYEPIDGDEFVLSLPDPLLLSTHQNLQFVLSDYVPTDGYTLKSITRIPPPESIQHPVYVAD